MSSAARLSAAVFGDEIHFTRHLGDFANEELTAKRLKD
jgi:hypothetical protein